MDAPWDEQKALELAAIDFARLGYRGVTMRDLSERCGVSTQVLYYRFVSKEELYREACEYALDSFFEAVERQLESAKAEERGPKLLAEAFFDTWFQNPTPLLLTNHDVINALAQPDRWLTGQHYPKVLSLIGTLAQRYFNTPIDASFSFAFASATFGFCSLMLIDERYATMTDAARHASERKAYLFAKRTALADLCSRLWVGLG